MVPLSRLAGSPSDNAEANAQECADVLDFLCAQPSRKTYRRSLPKDMTIQLTEEAFLGLSLSSTSQKKLLEINLSDIKGLADIGSKFALISKSLSTLELVCYAFQCKIKSETRGVVQKLVELAMQHKDAEPFAHSHRTSAVSGNTSVGTAVSGGSAVDQTSPRWMSELPSPDDLLIAAKKTEEAEARAKAAETLAKQLQEQSAEDKAMLAEAELQRLQQEYRIAVAEKRAEAAKAKMSSLTANDIMHPSFEDEEGISKSTNIIEPKVKILHQNSDLTPTRQNSTRSSEVSSPQSSPNGENFWNFTPDSQRVVAPLNNSEERQREALNKVQETMNNMITRLGTDDLESKLKSENSELNKEIMLMKEKVNNLKTQLDTAKERIRFTEEESAKLVEALSESLAAVANAEAESVRLAEELKTITKSYEDEKANYLRIVEANKKEIESTEKREASVALEIHSLKLQVEALKTTQHENQMENVRDQQKAKAKAKKELQITNDKFEKLKLKQIETTQQSFGNGSHKNESNECIILSNDGRLDENNDITFEKNGIFLDHSNVQRNVTTRLGKSKFSANGSAVHPSEEIFKVTEPSLSRNSKKNISELGRSNDIYKRDTHPLEEKVSISPQNITNMKSKQNKKYLGTVNPKVGRHSSSGSTSMAESFEFSFKASLSDLLRDVDDEYVEHSLYTPNKIEKSCAVEPSLEDVSKSQSGDPLKEKLCIQKNVGKDIWTNDEDGISDFLSGLLSQPDLNCNTFSEHAIEGHDHFNVIPDRSDDFEILSKSKESSKTRNKNLKNRKEEENQKDQKEYQNRGTSRRKSTIP
eukprot:UC4_evm1s1514